MTLSDLSELTRLSRSEIARLEMGLRELRGEHLLRFAKAFGISPSEIVAPEDAARLLAPLGLHGGSNEASTQREVAATREQDRLGIFGQVRGDRLYNLSMCVGFTSLALPNGLSRQAFVCFNPRSDLYGIRPGSLLVVTTLIPPARGDLCLIRHHDDDTGEVSLFEASPPPRSSALTIAAILLK